jgi:putative oxidoreductase
MRNIMKKLFLLLGRICLSLIFVASAVGKLFSWNETVQYMTSSLARWTGGAPMPEMISLGPMSTALSFMTAHAVLFLVISTLLEGIGGLFVLLGFRIRFGAILLMLFIIPVTLIMHSFWLDNGPEKMIQMSMFMKNLSILGGLMILAVRGSEGEGV